MRLYEGQILRLKVKRRILNPLIYTLLISGFGLMACEDKTTQVATSSPEVGSEQGATSEEEAGSEQEVTSAEEAGSEQEATSEEEAGNEEEAESEEEREALSVECASSCDALLDCINTSEDSACQTDAVTLDLISSACQDRCESFAPFSVIASGIDTCEDWFVFAEQQLEEDWLSECGGSSSSLSIDCRPFGDRITSCMLEACMPLNTYETGLANFMTSLCQDQASMDQDAAAFLASVDESMPCTHPILEAYTNYFLQENPSDPEAGSLAEICEGNPQNTEETCDNACRHLGPCIPPGSDGEALADYDNCTFYCALSPEIPSELWQCLEESALCSSVGNCFAMAEEE